MTDWRVAKSLDVLLDEINEAHPDRPKGADGAIGDARHQAEQSDHNPLPPHPGVVTARDFTTAPWLPAVAERLRLLAKAGDLRVKYLIYQGRIASSKQDWAWRPYTGYSKHFDHLHISVSDHPDQYDRTDPWLAPAPAPTVLEDDMKDLYVLALDSGGHYLSDLMTKRRIAGTAAETALLKLGATKLDWPEADINAIPTTK